MNHSLESTQKLFLDFLYKNEGFEEIKANIVSPSPYEVLQIHRRHVWKSLRNSLQTHYKVLYNFLSKEIFDELSHLYIADNPSMVPDLELYGWSFPEFLKKQMPEDKLSHDIAKLSIAGVRAIIGPKYVCTPIEDFLAIPQNHYENVVFQINPTCIMCNLSYDIFYPFLNTKDFTNCEYKPNTIAVARASNNNLNYLKLSDTERLFLSMCTQKEKLLNIFEKIDPEKLDMQVLLPKLVQNQIIYSFSISNL